ncbi:SPOR domain-containing protein [Kordia sp.]|uniref:SPOR domain-containing protein n=1 Tax=Kordia sp. TaxID=1965332 RepID=UPI003D28C4A7
MESDKFEKTKYWIELAKWFIVSVALVLISNIVNWNFTSRDKSFDEVKFYSEKYMTELIVLNDKVGPRYKLAQFFKNVIVNKDQRDGWIRYYDDVKKEYNNLKKKDSIDKLKKQKILEKDSTKWNESEKEQFRILQNEIEKMDIQLNSELQLPNEEKQKYYIIVGSGKTLKEAEDEKNKFMSFDSKIILRNGSYRIVIEFNSYENASKNISVIKTKKSDAYIVNAHKWCSNLIQKESHYECN